MLTPKKVKPVPHPLRKQIVAKFGGTSVGSSAAMKQVCHVLTRDATARMGVLSAVSGVTNQLVAFGREVAGRSEILERICDQHLLIARELGIEGVAAQDLQALFQELEAYVSQTVTPAAFDTILSFGERLSTVLVYHLLKTQGHPVVLWDARKFIITDHHFGKAMPLLNEIKPRVENALAQLQGDEIILTQGFIGATLEGQTTTVGRGGSDYTAALFAEAMGAEQLYIYTDVRGVYTMDPNRVREARFISHLGFQEMAELANFGAKILHPATIAPCVRASIPVVIASTFEPDAGHTLITAASPKPLEQAVPVQAIALRKDQTLLTIKSLHMLNAHGFLANIFTILSNHKISVDVITTSEVSVALTVDGSQNAHGDHPFTDPELLAQLQAFAEVSIEEGLTLVTLVGPNLSKHTGAVQEVVSAMREVPLRLICQGASASNISFLMPAAIANDAAALLHHKFIEI